MKRFWICLFLITLVGPAVYPDSIRPPYRPEPEMRQLESSTILRHAETISEVRKLLSNGGLRFEEMLDRGCLEKDFFEKTRLNRSLGNFVKSVTLKKLVFNVQQDARTWTEIFYGLELEFSRPSKKSVPDLCKTIEKPKPFRLDPRETL